MNINIMLAPRPQDGDILYEILQREMYFVTVVSSQDEASASLGSKQFDVAMVDEDFDGPNTGWELAKKIREMPDSKMSIIFLSRNKKYANEYFRRNEYNNLFDWLLVFPLPEEQFLGEIKRRLSMNRD